MFFERIKEQKKRDLPFVVYRASSEKKDHLRAFFQNSAEVYKTTTFSENGFVFAPFDSGKEAILFPKENCEIHETVLNNAEAFQLPLVSEDSFFEATAGKEIHLDLVQKGIDAIKQGRIKKVVLSRKEILLTETPDVVELFLKLLNKYPGAFVYLMHHPKVGTWLGATPEVLLQVERNRLKTMALAGTKKYTGENESAWGRKEKEEQQIVTDIILESLQETCSNLVTKGPYTARAGNLLHLRTDITGEINSDNPKSDIKKENPGTDAMHRVSTRNLKKLIYSIHPTPAICGHPLEEAREFILENENYDREYYTGFLGEINMKHEVKRSNNRRNQENQAYSSFVTRTSLFVNLRCMKVSEDSAEIFVGGGITKESNPESEWEETRNKAATMKAVLNLDSKIE